MPTSTTTGSSVNGNEFFTTTSFDFDDPGWAKISSDGRELVKTLLARDARDRLTVYGVLQHPFCAEDVNLAINTSRVSRLQSADFDQALNLLDDDE